MDADQVWIGSTPNRTALRVGSAGRSAGRFRKGPAGAPLQPVRGYTASCGAPPRAAPPRPARPGSHTVTCVTDTGRAGWRTPRGEGTRARARPLHTASLSFSLATGRRPSPPGGARIGGKLTSRTRRAE